jgi:hypothetical protein
MLIQAVKYVTNFHVKIYFKIKNVFIFYLTFSYPVYRVQQIIL